MYRVRLDPLVEFKAVKSQIAPVLYAGDFPSFDEMVDGRFALAPEVSRRLRCVQQPRDQPCRQCVRQPCDEVLVDHGFTPSPSPLAGLQPRLPRRASGTQMTRATKSRTPSDPANRRRDRKSVV